jgi:hypothetical protein
MSTQDRLRGFWYPIFEKSPNRFKKTLVLSCNGIEQYVNDSKKIIYTSRLKGNALEVLKWDNKNRKFLQKQINAICAKHNLSKSSTFAIYNTILASVILIEQYHQLFKVDKPCGFLTIDDQHVHGAVICNILNSYNIPTYTQIHGAIGVQSMVDFIPINAKYVLCWGNYMKKLFLNEGVAESSLIVTGCQRARKQTKLSTESIYGIKRKIGITVNDLRKPIILFGFTRLITKNWIQDIIELKKGLGYEFQLTGRLHPSTTLSEVKEIKNVLGNEIIILESSDLKLKEHISIADYIIIDSSTLGFDALIQEKTVIVLDSNTELKTQDVMYDLLRANAAILCRSTKEVVEFLHSEKTQSDLRLNSANFVRNYISNYDEQAAVKIIEEIAAKTK